MKNFKRFIVGILTVATLFAVIVCTSTQETELSSDINEKSSEYVDGKGWGDI